MSVVKMSKLRLIGLNSEKNELLDELYILSCAHIKDVEHIEGTKLGDNAELEAGMKEKIDRCKKAIAVLDKLAEKPQEELNCSFKHFVEQDKNEEKNIKIVNEINSYLDSINGLYNKILKCRAEQLDIVPMDIRKLNSLNLNMSNKTLENSGSETKKILDAIYHKLLEVNETYVFGEYERLDIREDVAHNLYIVFRLNISDYQNMVYNLKKFNLVVTKTDESKGEIEFYYSFKRGMPEFFREMEKRLKELEKRIAELEVQILGFYNKIKAFLPQSDALKVFTDFLSYKLETYRAEDSMVSTESTCVLECFVPKKQVSEFKTNIKSKFPALVITELPISESDAPPTKLKGGKITSSANFVVNMYSVPKYGEADPTFSVFFFFVIFFGFIMADVGYGIVLTLLGFLLARHVKKSSPNKSAANLWFLIGVGGISSIVWGMLFGSYFGFSHNEIDLLPAGVMPSPQNEPIPLLLFCLLMGSCQIIVGFVMRGINYFKHRKYSEGVVNGFAWAIFLLGATMWAANGLVGFFGLELSEGFANVLSMIEGPGLIVLITGLAVGVLFAGIGSRGFTKFTKSFSAIYGLLNLFSDILSYARLFGLMLSSAIIAQQFNAIGLDMLGNPLGNILGVLVILIGHTFNVAMGALSAYIHDVRLQYVEYFGKFYEGDGIAFQPFGAQLSYVKIVNDGRK